MRSWSIATTLFLGLFTITAMAQSDVHIEATLSPSEMPFYKSTTFTITVEALESTDVELPDLRLAFEQQKLMNEEMPMADYRKEPLGNGRIRITESYTLEPIFVKDYFFDPIVVTLNGEDTVTIPSPVLRVRELTVAEQEAIALFHADIAGGPEAAPRPVTARWQFWVLVTLMALAVVGLLVYWWLTHRELQAILPAKDPWETALARLEALAQRNLAKEGKFEAYYVDLSAILRYYIEGRFTLHAPERTTPEFLAEMMETDLFTKEQEEFLKTFLRLCDRVKFAQHEPGLLDMEASFTQVSKFVENTVPINNDVIEEAA